MEIRHSLGRFLSIFFIVAIGCAFFSGIRASEPDMRYSGDAYFDEKKNRNMCFSIEDVKRYYAEARRSLPKNPSMSLNRLAEKGY